MMWCRDLEKDVRFCSGQCRICKIKRSILKDIDESELSKLIDKKIENVLSELMEYMNIDSGDVTPLQSKNWDSLCDQMSALLFAIIDQNKGSEEKAE